VFPGKICGGKPPNAMSRLLTFAIVFLVIYFAWKGMARKDRLREQTRRRAATTASGEDMVTCARCGVNVPASEAKSEAGRLVCADNPRCRGPA
jgi:uncharacterized protein